LAAAGNRIWPIDVLEVMSILLMLVVKHGINLLSALVMSNHSAPENGRNEHEYLLGLVKHR